jgi:hypothetical protein
MPVVMVTSGGDYHMRATFIHGLRTVTKHCAGQQKQPSSRYSLQLTEIVLSFMMLDALNQS